MLVTQLGDWDPLADPSRAAHLIGEWKPLLAGGHAQEGGALLHARSVAVFEAMADGSAMPIVRASLLGHWNAHDVEPCVRLVDSLEGVVSPSSLDDLLQVVVFPKLQRAVDAWHAHESPPHLWLHPWLPRLSRELEPLFPSLRRKLLAALGPCDVTTAGRGATLLGPWASVFDARSNETMALTVGGRLAGQMRRVVVNPADQQLDLLDSCLALATVLPRSPVDHAEILLRGELFPRWHATLVDWLSRSDASANSDLVAWYKGWHEYFGEKGVLGDGVRAELAHGLALMRAGRSQQPAAFLEAFQRNKSATYASALRAATSAPSHAPALGPEKKEGTSKVADHPSSFLAVVEEFAESRGGMFLLPSLGVAPTVVS